MRLSATAFAASLLVLAIAASSIPPSAAIEKVGEIVLDPTHALPGTLVSFEGIGWDLNTFSKCIVYGYPVKIDSHAICRVHVRLGVHEPFGTFVVKDVPAGTYSVSVVADPTPWSGPAPPGWNYTGEAKFTVDAAAAPIPEFPLPVLILLSSLIATYAISTRRKAEAAS